MVGVQRPGTTHARNVVADLSVAVVAVPAATGVGRRRLWAARGMAGAAAGAVLVVSRWPHAWFSA